MLDKNVRHVEYKMYCIHLLPVGLCASVHPSSDGSDSYVAVSAVLVFSLFDHSSLLVLDEIVRSDAEEMAPV